MTREEALKILKEDGCGHCTWQSTNPYECENKECEVKEAFNMAIQALSQECVGSTQQNVGNALDMRCDDAISRQAVLNAIEHEDKWLLAAKGHNGLTEIAFSGLKARVDALPSVTQKSGKWIRTPLLTCDRCNKINKSGEETDYCPNCGCRMVEPQESEE